MTERLEAVSWSEIKTFQRCPKQHEYKYIQRLVPKQKQRPLFLGNWIHAALESHYKQGDWKIGHLEYVKQWNGLFEEERVALRTRGRSKKLGPPFPDIVTRIMKSYLWYYRDEGWNVKAIEQRFSVDTPLKIDGKIQTLDGIIDLVVEDDEGRWWIVDHKTASTIPEPTSFHAMDPQLMLYPWAAKIAFGWDIAGIIYNYVKSKPPTIPELTKRTGQLSRRKILTDYPTLLRFLRSNGFDPREFQDQLRPLRKRSPFLRRYRLPRETVVTREILLDTLTTAKHIHKDKHRYRVITRDCSRTCPYHDLCRAELNGFDTTQLRRMSYTLKEEKSLGDRSDDYTEDDEGEVE